MRLVSMALLTVACSAAALPTMAPPTMAQADKPAAPPARPAVPATPAVERPFPTLNIVVPERDRNAVYAYYRDEIAAGRCPPPLVRRDKACQAPSPGKVVWKLDQPLPDDVKTEAPPAALIVKLSASPAGYQYMRVDNDLLLVGVGTRIVTALVADLSRI
jgi:hypothetical protein